MTAAGGAPGFADKKGFVATLIAAPGHILTQDLIAAIVAQNKGGRSEVIGGGTAADLYCEASPVIPASDVYDCLIQPAANRVKKILIADMESTIIEQEMLDELAAEIGVGERVATITRRAMNGELDFEAALRERVALLKGQPQELLDKVAARMTFMAGAGDLLAALKKSGAKCWLVSGGFTCFVKIIAGRLGFDQFFANQLLVRGGVITGEVGAPILDKTSKKTLLEKACADYGCTLADTMAVGDGANDIPMLQACAAGGGLGVAFRAKPKVREVIGNRIDRCDLSALILAQGIEA
jgi:phosphoserine phosphatase